MIGSDLVRLLESKRYDTSSELEMQSSTQDVLTEAGVSFIREFRFNPRERVDFFVEGGIALELKIEGSMNAIARQLMRYAMIEEVAEVVLFTTLTRHCNMIRHLNGKPVHVALYQRFYS